MKIFQKILKKLNFFKLNFNNSNGFTLIELIIVVAIIGVLAGIGILALNPGNRMANTRNAERKVNVNTIMNAIYQYSIDNNGSFPIGIDSETSTSQVLGTSISGCDITCTATTTLSTCLDLSSDLVADYLVEIPYDPLSGVATNTDYYINKDANSRIIIGSCDAEINEVIEVKR